MQSKIQRSLIALALATLYLPVTFAQSNDDDEELALIYGNKSTISIATGHQQPLRRAPAVATVITAQDIARMGATDIDHVLETVPGLHIARNSIAYAPIYSFRGVFSAYDPQSLMMINGIPITMMFTSGRGNIWGGYPIENIARIEIIRGPGSALHGADAFSGVINIVTKTAADIDGTEVGMRVNSNQGKEAWINHSSTDGPLQIASYLQVGGFGGFSGTINRDAASSRQVSHAPGSINTGYDAIDGHLDVALDNLRWRVNYKLRDNVESGAGVSQALDPVGRGRSERIMTDLAWTAPNLVKDWDLGATVSYTEFNETVPVPYNLLPPGQTAYPNGMIGAPEKWERHIRTSAYATYSGFIGHTVRMGVGHNDLNLYRTRERKNFDASFTALASMIDAGAADIFLLPHRRKINYLYLQDEWQLAPDWALTAGIRRDIYSDFGATNNPRLALVWDVSYDLTAKLLYGRAFRAPSFVELYSINNPVSKGNASLRPETNTTVEGVLNWRAAKDLELNLTVFHYAMKDIIRIPASGTTFTNTGDQVGNGFELEGVWSASRNLNLTANYSHQHAVDIATQQDAGYVPRNHAYARADWRYSSEWTFSSQINWVADRKRAPGDKRANTVPDYTTLDLTARTRLSSKGWELAASIRNLLNEKVMEPSLAPGTSIPNDLPMAGRTLYVQLSHKLQ